MQAVGRAMVLPVAWRVSVETGGSALLQPTRLFGGVWELRESDEVQNQSRGFL